MENSGESLTKSGGPRPIFVSYVREEQRTVEGLAGQLTSAGFDVYFDSKLAGGQDWWDELIGHIRKCDAFVPALSDPYIHSTPCRLEREYAASLGKPICPVQIDDVNRRLLPSEIGSLQIERFVADDPNSILRIVRALLWLPACTKLPDPLPPPPQAPVSYLFPIVSQIDSPEPLAEADQWKVLNELKSLLHEEGAADVLKLLARFKKRPWLLYRVALEVDELLATPTEPRIQAATDKRDPLFRERPKQSGSPPEGLLDLTDEPAASAVTPERNPNLSVCPYCHWGLVAEADDPIVRCPSCSANYHQSCWIENVGCARFGCTEWIRTQRPQPELQH